MDQFFENLATTFANLETTALKQEFCANLFNSWHELATQTVEALFTENENAVELVNSLNESGPETDKALEKLELDEFMIGKMEEALQGVKVHATNGILTEW